MPNDLVKKICEELGVTEDEIKQRLSGKKKEDEFVIFLLFMDVCKSLTAFDEGISKVFTTSTSDLLIQLKNGKKFILEIKSTKNGKYKISGGNLEKKIDYAKSFDLPLYFAVNISNRWMLFDSEYIKKKGGAITIADDYLNSTLDEVIGTMTYLFPPGMMIRTVYKKEYNEVMPIINEEYGGLVSYTFSYKDNIIFRVEETKNPCFFCMIVLQALQDQMSIANQEVEHNGETTIVIEKSENNLCVSEYDFIFAMFKHMINPSGETYSISDVLEELKDEPNKYFVQVNSVRQVIQYLVDNGSVIFKIKGENIYEIPKIKG